MSSLTAAGDGDACPASPQSIGEFVSSSLSSTVQPLAGWPRRSTGATLTSRVAGPTTAVVVAGAGAGAGAVAVAAAGPPGGAPSPAQPARAVTVITSAARMAGHPSKPPARRAVLPAHISVSHPARSRRHGI